MLTVYAPTVALCHKLLLRFFTKRVLTRAVFVLFKIQVLRPCLMADFAAFVVDTGITDVCPDCGLVIVNPQSGYWQPVARTSEGICPGPRRFA
ncbi:hypothetical protein [Escherichia coli]|uniref:hypothetical protein n=1 Tax=Escherichia coli TaxID=562 RepID=UPI0039A686B4